MIEKEEIQEIFCINVSNIFYLFIFRYSIAVVAIFVVAVSCVFVSVGFQSILEIVLFLVEFVVVFIHRSNKTKEEDNCVTCIHILFSKEILNDETFLTLVGPSFFPGFEEINRKYLNYYCILLK